jgi:hypothetical protein
MYVNAEIIPVETVSGIWEMGMEDSLGGGDFKYDILIHCKNLCKCHKVSPPSNTIKKKGK